MIINPVQNTAGVIGQAGDIKTDLQERRDSALQQRMVSAGSQRVSSLANNSNASTEENSGEITGAKTGPPRPDYKKLEQDISKLFEADKVSIRFEKDQDSQQMVLKVIDSKTNEVMQQLPTELALKISRLVTSMLDQGKVTDAKV
jgi:flagellar protein FlaG